LPRQDAAAVHRWGLLLPSPQPAPLRCHLLIGPPASGKTTLVGVLAELTGAVVLSTDGLRGEIFGDAAVQGPWRDIEALLHQRIRETVAAGVPVIVDATHARRPWRLAITQALALPGPVEWIGWWLYTPLATCLQWNHTHQRELEPLLRDELARLDHRIRSARNREKRFSLHGYSQLLDLERLLYLVRLLGTVPELSVADPAPAPSWRRSCRPFPRAIRADPGRSGLAGGQRLLPERAFAGTDSDGTDSGGATPPRADPRRPLARRGARRLPAPGRCAGVPAGVHPAAPPAAATL
jgi:predicted kinase